MKPHKIFIKFSFFLSLILELSCMNVPVEITIPKIVKITEGTYQEQAKGVKQELLKGLNLGNASCEAAFAEWIEAQFDTGRVPKRAVTALEYGAKSPDPLIAQCRGVDLTKEIPEAFHKEFQKHGTVLPSVFFDVSEFRKKLESRECSEDYLDPEKRKLTLKGMKTRIYYNTLNIDAPLYNVYYTTRRLSENVVKAPHAEKELLASGAISFLGTTRTFAPGFKGAQPVDFVHDPKKLQAARDSFYGLRSDLVAFPADTETKPQTSFVGDNAYFLIPKGECNLRVELDVEVNVSMRDAQCALTKFKSLTQP